MADQKPVVGIIMGSKSDLGVMEGCTAELEALGVPYELVIASAHRTPAKVHEWASTAADRGIRRQGCSPGRCRGCVYVAAGYRRAYEDERSGWYGLAAVDGADAFGRARCLCGHQRCQERCHLRHADSGRMRLRVPQGYREDEAGDG